MRLAGVFAVSFGLTSAKSIQRNIKKKSRFGSARSGSEQDHVKQGSCKLTRHGG